MSPAALASDAWPPWPRRYFCLLVTATGVCLGVLEGGDERVAPRTGDRPGQDLQHASRGLHVDRRARGHNTDGLAAHGTLGVGDLAKVGNRQLRSALIDRSIDDQLLERRRAFPGLLET